ncbi:MAG: flagellar basal body P-ring formation chaperone FlgA [Pseudomonadota bacterium]
MRPLVLAILMLGAGPLAAESLVAAGTIRSKTLIGPEHLALSPDVHPGALSDPGDALGLEARVAIYAGRPIRPADLGPPAVVDRNQIVTLVFYRAGLEIRTEGRALSRGAAGETVRALNLSSRNTVTGIADDAGRIHVGAAPTSFGTR